jgi:hypothetical protein
MTIHEERGEEKGTRMAMGHGEEKRTNGKLAVNTYS